MLLVALDAKLAEMEDDMFDRLALSESKGQDLLQAAQTRHETRCADMRAEMAAEHEEAMTKLKGTDAAHLEELRKGWAVETDAAIKAAVVREKENSQSALMALMTSHERALEDLRAKQDAKDHMYAKEREDRNDAQSKAALEHEAVLKTQQRAFEELQSNMATQLNRAKDDLGSVKAEFDRERDELQQSWERKMADLKRETDISVQSAWEKAVTDTTHTLNEEKGKAVMEAVTKWQKLLQESVQNAKADAQSDIRDAVFKKDAEWKKAAEEVRKLHAAELEKVQEFAEQGIKAAENKTEAAVRLEKMQGEERQKHAVSLAVEAAESIANARIADMATAHTHEVHRVVADLTEKLEASNHKAKQVAQVAGTVGEVKQKYADEIRLRELEAVSRQRAEQELARMVQP